MLFKIQMRTCDQPVISVQFANLSNNPLKQIEMLPLFWHLKTIMGEKFHFTTIIVSIENNKAIIIHES